MKMCQFNLIITDKKSNKGDLKQIFTECEFGYQELEIKSLRSQIGVDKKIILTTKGQCDCGSILGLNNQNLASIDFEKEKKKLKKNKWSQAKIERYLSDKLKEENKRNWDVDLQREMEGNNWMKLSKILLKRQSKFGVFFQQFTGLIEDENIEIEKTNKISIGLLSKNELRNLKEKHLSWIVK